MKTEKHQHRPKKTYQSSSTDRWIFALLYYNLCCAIVKYIC